MVKNHNSGLFMPFLKKNTLRILFLSAGCAFFFIGGIFSPAKAYTGCPDSPQGVRATIEEDRVTFSNLSSECRHIGIVVYRLFSETEREGAFYYSNMTGLRSGSTRSYSIDPPLCSYVIDAIVGKPIKTARSKADYGSRLLVERVVKTSLGFCSPSNSGTASVSSPRLPQAKSAPLPQPKVVAAPLPQPKVLGASITPTSTSPLAANTGGDAALPLALLASILASGAAVLVKRTFHPKFLHHYCHDYENGPHV